MIFTSAPRDNKYSTVSLWPAEEAVNKITLIQILSIIFFNDYLPKNKGVRPMSSLTLTSAPWENKYSTVSLWPAEAAIKEIE